MNYRKGQKALTIPHDRHWRLARTCRRCLVDSKAENTKENEKMRTIKIYDRTTKSYIGEVKANKDQIRTIEHDFIVKEV